MSDRTPPPRRSARFAARPLGVKIGVVVALPALVVLATHYLAVSRIGDARDSRQAVHEQSPEPLSGELAEQSAEFAQALGGHQPYVVAQEAIAEFVTTRERWAADEAGSAIRLLAAAVPALIAGVLTAAVVRRIVRSMRSAQRAAEARATGAMAAVRPPVSFPTFSARRTGAMRQGLRPAHRRRRGVPPGGRPRHHRGAVDLLIRPASPCSAPGGSTRPLGCR